MAESDAENAVEPNGESPGGGKFRKILVSLILAVGLGGGGFYAVYSGLIPLGGGAAPGTHAAAGGGKDGKDGSGQAHGHDAAYDSPPAKSYEKPAFVTLEPFVVSLGQTASSRHLRVGLTVEVTPGTEDAVVAAIPRINDVLNTYLRAVDQRDFEVPRAMTRLRAQMLRRVRLVAPPDSVRDLLFQEFVLN